MYSHQRCCPKPTDKQRVTKVPAKDAEKVRGSSISTIRAMQIISNQSALLSLLLQFQNRLLVKLVWPGSGLTTEENYGQYNLIVIQVEDIMLYPILGVGAGLGAFYYNAVIRKDNRQESAGLEKDKEEQVQIKPQAIVSDYTELRRKENQFILYSRLHKQPLSTHTLLTRANISLGADKKGEERKEVSNQGDQKSEKGEESVVKTEGKTEAKAEANTEAMGEETTSQTSSLSTNSQSQSSEEQQLSEVNKNQTLFKNFFQKYAQQLLLSDKCQSVELIEGPIFSKDTPYKYKPKGSEEYQTYDQIYKSTIKIAPSGEYLTNRFYAIVICNSSTRNHLNGFTMRKAGQPTFRMTNYLTSLIKIEEQTGLTFNVSGEPLTVIDFDNINKDRTFADYE